MIDDAKLAERKIDHVDPVRGHRWIIVRKLQYLVHSRGSFGEQIHEKEAQNEQNRCYDMWPWIAQRSSCT